MFHCFILTWTDASIEEFLGIKLSVSRFLDYLEPSDSRDSFSDLVKEMEAEKPFQQKEFIELVICRIREKNFVTKKYLNKYMQVHNLCDATLRDFLSVNAERFTYILKNDSALVTLYNRWKDIIPVFEYETKEPVSLAVEKIKLKPHKNKYYGEERYLQGTFCFTRA